MMSYIGDMKMPADDEFDEEELEAELQQLEEEEKNKS